MKSASPWNSWPDELLGLVLVGRHEIGLGGDAQAQRVALGVQHHRHLAPPQLAHVCAYQSCGTRRGSEPASTTPCAPRDR